MSIVFPESNTPMLSENAGYDIHGLYCNYWNTAIAMARNRSVLQHLPTRLTKFVGSY